MVIPLVAGLFVMVEALHKTELTKSISTLLHHELQRSVTAAAWISGLSVAFSCNLMNNLPAGLIAGDIIQGSQVPGLVKNTVLIGLIWALTFP